MVELKTLYRLANSVASSFRIQGYEHDDLVQECVLKALDIQDKPNRYIWVTMRNHLKDLAKRRREDLLPFIDIAGEPTARIPVPLHSSRVTAVTLAMIRTGSVAESAKNLKWSYWTVIRAWRDAKRLIKKELSDDK